MFRIIWRYQVAAAQQPVFESTYGSSGAWAKLFTQSCAFLGTDLFKSVQADFLSYIVIDQWKSREDYLNFLLLQADAYQQLSEQCKKYYKAEERLGEFLSQP